VDLKRLAALDGVVVVDADQSFGRKEADSETERRQRAGILAPANLGLSETRGRAFLLLASFIEATPDVLAPEELGFPSNTKRTWTSAVANPAGRNALEPFALQLANSDATLLGMGSNGYTLGNPLLREFLSEYRALPAAAFKLRTSATAPVVVRELQANGQLLFYAVNTTAQPVRVEVGLSGASRIEHLRDSSAIVSKGGRLTLELDGFALSAIRAVGNARIASVSVVR